MDKPTVALKVSLPELALFKEALTTERDLAIDVLNDTSGSVNRKPLQAKILQLNDLLGKLS
jgi:hypothetical protein